MEQRQFRSEKHQQEFDEKGFVVLPYFDAAQIQELQQLYREYYHNRAQEGFHTLVNLPEVSIRKEIYHKIRAYYQPRLEEYLIDFEAFIASFAVKEPGEVSRIPLHLDWSVLDESRFTSLNNWVPLIDTNAENGCLCMLEGSHRYEFTWRGSSINNIATRSTGGGIMQEMVQRYPVRPLCMQAGTGVMYSHRMAHFSVPNLSSSPRIATSLVAIPQAAEPLHYHFNEDQSITQYRSSTDFYLNYQHGKTPSFGLNPWKTISPEDIGRQEDQVRALINLDGKVQAALASKN